MRCQWYRQTPPPKPVPAQQCPFRHRRASRQGPSDRSPPGSPAGGSPRRAADGLFHNLKPRSSPPPQPHTVPGPPRLRQTTSRQDAPGQRRNFAARQAGRSADGPAPADVAPPEWPLARHQTPGCVPGRQGRHPETVPAPEGPAPAGFLPGRLQAAR